MLKTFFQKVFRICKCNSDNKLEENENNNDDNKYAESKPRKQINNVCEFVMNPNDFVLPKTASIFNQYYLRKTPLGSGSYAEVRIGVHRLTGIERAVKIITKYQLNQNERAKLYSEIQILKKLDHPNIVKIFDFFDDENYLYIVQELCTGGELFDKICDEGQVSEQYAAQIFKQIISAVSYCHQNGIAHRDLKPENILLKSQNEKILKIIDFGGSIEFSKKIQLTGRIGTPFYVAPEVLSQKYDNKCDVWSCGVILYLMLCGYPPFNDNDENKILKLVQKAHYDFKGQEWEYVSNKAKRFIRKMIEIDVDKRISAQDALNDDWIVNNTREDSDQQGQMLQTQCLQNLKSFRIQSQLQDCIYTYIVTFLANTYEQEELQVTFSQLDKNNDGCLQKQELIDGYSGIYGPTISETIVDDIFEQLNKQDSDTLSYSDWIKAVVDKRQLLTDENLKRAFSLFDESGRGDITIQDLKTHFNGIGDVDDNVWYQLVSQADQDGNNMISFQEFKQMMEQMLKKESVISKYINPKKLKFNKKSHSFSSQKKSYNQDQKMRRSYNDQKFNQIFKKQ